MSLFKNQTRIAMAYTNKVGDKIYPVVVDIKKGIKSTEDIQFVSSDVNTGILSVAFIQGNDNYNVTGADVVCSVMRPDASTLELPCEVVGENIVEVPLGINGTSQDGVYSFDFKVFKGENKVVGTPIMNYSVSLSISNDTVVEEDDRLPVLTVLMTQITALKNETKDVISTANTAIQNANKATDDTKLAISNAQSATQEAEDVIARVNNAIASGTQDLEVREARDGETSLKARLDRDIEKAKQVYVNVEGSHISTDSSSGYLKDVEIKGNTIQDASNLADIRSVGDKVEGQELYEIPVLSCGKNLFNGEYFDGYINDTNGVGVAGNNNLYSNFIKVIPNTDYVISYNITKTTVIAEYSSDKQFIKRDIKSQKFRTGEHTYYIRFQNNFTSIDKPIFTQLEEGTVVTPYEPYQEDKLTILSPVQLEKVGDVADRIICKDGVWGVEKNVGNIILNGTETNWTWLNTLTNTARFQLPLNCSNTNDNTKINTISTVLPSIAPINGYQVDNEGVFCNHDTKNLTIRISILKLNSVNTNGLKTWLQNNPIKVFYQTTQPTFIPLPHDQQVKLRTFANKTNISFLTEIEGTIKAQVPKSLGATVNTHTTQIDNLNKELDRVKKLEESTVSTVETESNFTTVEATSNGYFEDVKLEGKTLVNLPRRQVSYYPSGSNGAIIVSDSNVTCYEYEIKPNTTYTIKKDEVSDRGTVALFSSNSVGSVATKTLISMISDGKISTIRTGNEDKYMLLYVNSTLISSGVKTTVLEGDHTQNPPSYFEGLKSVGQSASEDGADEIVVSSVKGDGNLLFFKKDISYTSNGITYTVDAKTQVITVNGTCTADNTSFTVVDALPKQIYNGVYSCTVEKLTDFSSPITVRTYNKDYSNGVVFNIQNSLSGTMKKPYVNDEIVFSLRIDKGATFNNAKFKVSFYKGGEFKPYTPHKADKKRLLFYNNETQAWEKPILREWDSIEKHSNGKYYYHQRSGEVVLNGSESWTFSPGHSDITTSLFYYRIDDRTPNSECICDKFTRINGHTVDYPEGVYYGADINIRISTSKLSTQDVQGFKQWLQANNVTVVYQLAEEKVYECTNIDLITYANETNYIVESGAIAPKTILKVHNNISNVVKILQEKVSLLESNVKASQEVQDMMILETDMRMLDIELALMEFMPMKLNLGGSDMLRSATYFNFVKNHIINETYEKEYLENVMNKYLATGRINQDEYDELYKMLYPPVYDIELPIEP